MRYKTWRSRTDTHLHLRLKGKRQDGTDMPSNCKDCGMDTTPYTGKRGCWEYYMVHSALWRKAKMRSDGGFLCIGCLERRLGRMLTVNDFTTAPVNDVHPWDTERLVLRKRAQPQAVSRQ